MAQQTLRVMAAARTGHWSMTMTTTTPVATTTQNPSDPEQIAWDLTELYSDG